MMPPMTGEVRDFDLVLFGATGFTGGLTAEYLADHAPEGLRWALAGRSPERLAAVRDRLATDHPELADLELLTADATDPIALADVARRARVVISTVGPFVQYGEPLVAACAEAGTDYLDITGEQEFVDRMYVAHHQTAVASGARLVHCCGFDSVPPDLGAYFTVQQLDATRPIDLRGVVRSNAAPSGGTYHTVVTAASRVRQARAASSARRRVESRPEDRSARAVAGKPHRDPDLGYWLLPMPTVDASIVARSGRALAAYGPRFRYSHYAGTKSLRYAAGGVVGMAGVGLVAQVPPLRTLLLDRMESGQGPDPQRRERSYFTVDFVGTDGERTVHTRVTGGDPGYTETAKMLSESALSLAFDDNPTSAGQLTPAAAMGDHLLARLQAAGLRFEVIDV